jgi:osmotically-inducible protein OsmY
MSEGRKHPWDLRDSRLYHSPYPRTPLGDSNKMTERDPTFSESYQDNHRGKGPKERKRNDAQIKEDVSEALFVNPIVDASDIEVLVENNIVYLNGYVQNKEMKREAENCVEEVKGVYDVFNYLKPCPGRIVSPV